MKKLNYLLIILMTLLLAACKDAVSYEPIAENTASVSSIPDSQVNSVSVEEESKKIYVSIIGEVITPGIYILNDGARIFEALNMAGGITVDADVSNINLVDYLEDGMQINVPKKNSYVNGENSEITTNHSGKVNINSATLEELKTITGIGDTRAKAIIDYREKNGRFNSIEEIMNVSGIKETIFETIKDEIYAD